MPRKPREEVADGVHHVFARGNRKALIFLDDSDRDTYLVLLGRVVARTAWRCLAYCQASRASAIWRRCRTGVQPTLRSIPAHGGAGLVAEGGDLPGLSAVFRGLGRGRGRGPRRDRGARGPPRRARRGGGLALAVLPLAD